MAELRYFKYERKDDYIIIQKNNETKKLSTKQMFDVLFLLNSAIEKIADQILQKLKEKGIEIRKADIIYKNNKVLLVLPDKEIEIGRYGDNFLELKMPNF